MADRFRHREQKEMRIYALTIAKDGPKLKPSTVSPDATPEGPPPLIFVISPQTGLTARYDFDLEFTTRASSAGH